MPTEAVKTGLRTFERLRSPSSATARPAWSTEDTVPQPLPAARPGGFFVFGSPLLRLDSITEAVGRGTGCVVVSGSHGGLSAGRFALQAGVRLAVFNDAGTAAAALGARAGLRLRDWLAPISAA